MNPALREAAEIAKKPAPVVKPEERMAEWGLVTFTDEAWSFSTMVAARFAFELLEETAKDLGLKPDSREANKLAWFVPSRAGDFKIYEVYQKAGFHRESVKQSVRSVLDDPAPYEVPKRESNNVLARSNLLAFALGTPALERRAWVKVGANSLRAFSSPLALRPRTRTRIYG